MTTQKNSPSLAKLTQPVLPPILERSRLFQTVDRLREQHRVIWIQGPPGAGKTTLVASYLKARKLKHLWYQLDEGDADPGTWFHYLSLGMKQVAPRYKKPLPHLSPEYLPGITVFTRRFFEQLFSRLKSSGAVVFDNYQEVTNETFQNLMNMALQTIPQGTTVILLSRTDPPAVFARLQADQSMSVLEPAALQLTKQETSALMRRQSLQRPIKTDDSFADWLHEKTEGWLAGVVLLLARGDKSEKGSLAVEEIQEVAPIVFDYFASQVFEQQTKEEQEFLLKTACFTSMTAVMAKAVSGYEDARHYLTRLARAQYFTDQHGGREPLYQYHPLFRTFLLDHASRHFSRAEMCEVQRRAGFVAKQQGQLEDAVELLQQAGATADVVEEILGEAPTLFNQGRAQILSKWISCLPTDVVESNLWLRYWVANCAFLHNPHESQQLFEPLVDAFEEKKDVMGMLLAWCGMMDAITYSFDASYACLPEWIDRVSRWLKEIDTFPSPELEARVTFSMFSASIWVRLSDPETYAWEKKVQALIKTMPDRSQQILVGYHLHCYLTWLGDLQRAETIANQVKEWAHSAEVSPLAQVFGHHVQATHCWLTGKGGQCLQAFEMGRRIVDEHGLFMLMMGLNSHGFNGALLVGDYECASHLAGELEAIGKNDDGLWGAQYHDLCAILGFTTGDFQKALLHATRAIEIVVSLKNKFLEAMLRASRGHLFIELRELTKAKQELSNLHKLTQEVNSKPVFMFRSLLAARLALAQGKVQQSLHAIEEVLRLSRETGIVYFMGILPSHFKALCEQALKNEIEVNQALYLIKQLRLVAEDPFLASDSLPWPVKIYTLGKFLLMSQTVPIEFGRKIPKTPLALLKLLIASGGKDIRQDHVTDMLWPDADGDAAYRSLVTNLSRLRKLLQREDAILFSGGLLSINPEVCWVDSLSFQYLLKAAKQEGKEGHEAKSRELAERARALYKGDFLPHDEELWVLPVRAHLYKDQADLTDWLRPTKVANEQWSE